MPYQGPCVHYFWVLLVLTTWTTSRAADTQAGLTIGFAVQAGESARSNTPVRVDIVVPIAYGGVRHGTVQAGAMTARGDVTSPSLLDPDAKAPAGHERRVLWFILPEIKARETKLFQARLLRPTGALGASESPRFAWKDEPGRHVDLQFGERPFLRYMNQAYENDPSKRDLNNKPFHHLFDPRGERLVTKGSGGEYTHHQGLFYGFTRCTVSDGAKCNTWYCHDGEHELHRRTLEEFAGQAIGRHRTEIDWNDTQGKSFCGEVRELTAFNVPGGTLVEWSSRLRNLRGEVTLDGDPQHAGFQFRADNEVAERAKKEKLTYFLRPDGKGEPGTTRNWPADKQMTDLPWNAMSFVLGEKRYTAVYLDSPRNPKPSFYSERDYGRFGSWFGKQVLKEGRPTVDITYRIWLQEGEMTVAEAEALSRDFASPPKVEVKAVREVAEGSEDQ